MQRSLTSLQTSIISSANKDNVSCTLPTWMSEEKPQEGDVSLCKGWRFISELALVSILDWSQYRYTKTTDT